MMKKPGPSISAKLIISFALLLLSLIGVTALSWRTLDSVEDSARRVATHYAPQLNRISDAQVLMFRLSLEARHAMLVKTPQELEETLQRVGALRKQMLDHLSAFERDITTDEGRERFRKIRDADTVFWRLAGEVVTKIQAGDVDGAFAQLKGDLVPARDAMVKAITEQRGWQEQLITRSVEAASESAMFTKKVVLALALFTFALAVWIAWSLTSMIRGAFMRARTITERIAAGELGSEIYVKPGDEFGYLFASLANMQASLVQVLGGMRSVARQVAQASAEIDVTARDLAQGTDSQSNAIAGTTAATARMTESARGSAASVDTVSGLASEASRVATEGGQVVAQVVEKMRGIDDSSRKIGEIVNVIDGIAFQTNILALNAAVEAARAGEQGRGFAVVATEVRNLAQRSAAAAREVKALIAESAQRVESGSALVERAGQTMSAIVQSVQQVTDVMGEIAAAARDQAAGVESVNRAIGEIESAARRNAERVARTQDAATELRTQAEALDRAVGQFRFELSPAGAAPRSMPAATPVLAAA